MRKFGLIGYSLGHSFSKGYFSGKFEIEHITDAVYENFELSSIEEFPGILKNNPDLVGLNVTIPYKQDVIPYLDSLDHSAERIGAVNVIKINDVLKGFNTDYYGFKTSLEAFLGKDAGNVKALILGTGGASLAVSAALNDLEIPFLYISRKGGNSDKISYEAVNEEVLANYKLIINTTPLGTYPDTGQKPDLPYQYITGDHYLYDLVYNPEVTAFMQAGKEQGARVKNGYDMLVNQAEKAWQIWNQ